MPKRTTPLDLRGHGLPQSASRLLVAAILSLSPALSLFSAAQEPAPTPEPQTAATPQPEATATQPPASITGLRNDIDRIVGQAAGTTSWPLASDEVFVRRVYLDLVGMTPSFDEFSTFINDDSPTKRESLVERLLNDPRHASHMAKWLDITLMERRPKKHVDDTLWRNYLTDSFATAKPLNVICREILEAEGTADTSPAAKFWLARDVEPNTMTRDIGRFFFGRDLQCAQCHDHPHIDDYYQSDYYGVFAFVNRSFLFTDKESKVSVGEKAEGLVEFTSVFTGEKGQTGPRLPEGQRLVENPLAPDQLYQVAPADGVRPVPKFSRRHWLAQTCTDGTHEAFNRNWANRLWAVMFARGLVHPLDLHHADNPPSHPALLDLLAARLADSQFNTREFLREVALSQTYQRAFTVDESAVHADTVAGLQQQLNELQTAVAAFESQVEAQKPQTAEALAAWSDARRTLDNAIDQWLTAEQARLNLTSQQRAGTAKLAAAQSASQTLQQRLTHLKQALESLQKAQALVADPTIDPILATLQTQTQQRQTELEAAAAEVAKVQAEIMPLEQQIQAAAAQVAELSAARTQAEGPHETLWQQYRNARDQLDSLNWQHDRLVASQHTLQQQLDWSLARNQMVAATDRVNQLTVQLTEARTRQEQAAAELAKVNAQLQPLNEQRNTLATSLASTQSETTRLTSLQTELKTLETATQQAQTQLAESSLAPIVQLASQRSAQVAQQLTQTQADTQRLENELAQSAPQAAELTAMRDKLTAEHLAATETRTQLETALAQAQSEMSNVSAAFETQRQAWIELSQQRLTLGELKPLSPEQIAWSLMQVTGVIDANIAAQRAELDKAEPPTEEQLADPQFVASRQAKARQLAYEKLIPSTNVFVNLFGHGQGQPQEGFFATVDQSLFFANAGTIQGWIGQGGDSLYQRLRKIEAPEALVEHLYQSVFCRSPNPQELQLMTGYLTTPEMNRDELIREAIWATLSSAEFRFSR